MLTDPALSSRVRAFHGPVSLRSRRRSGAIVCLMLAGTAWTHVARAQATTPSPGQLAPRTFAPLAPAETFPLDLPASGEALPAGAADIPLTVRAVTLDDRGVPIPAEARQILDRLAGRPITLGELYAAAQRVEQLCADDGHFLTRVIIPPQTVLNGGVLHITVMPGFVERVDATAVPEAVRTRVQAILSPLINRKPVLRGEFERLLLLAGDVAGLSLRTTISPGQAPGAVVLTVDGNYRAVEGSIAIDNSLPAVLGRTAITINLAANSTLGHGELAYASLGMSSRDEPWRQAAAWRLFSAGVSWPVGLDGWPIESEYTWSATHPHVGQDIVDTVSEFQRLSLRTNYWLQRTRTSSVNMRFAIDATDAKQTATRFNDLLYDDRIRALRLGVDWNASVAPAMQVSMGWDESVGVHGLGSRRAPLAADGTPLSRQGASDAFDKLEMRFRLRQSLSARVSSDVSARCQYARRTPLVTSEKFSMGGTEDLSVADASSISGDRGCVVRSELQWQFTPPNLAAWTSSTTQLYVFAAHGQATTLMPTQAQAAVLAATDAGLGLRSSAPGWAGSSMPIEFDIEAAYQRSKNEGPPRGDARARAGVTLRF